MHTLAVYGASSRAEAALREIASLVQAHGARLTVVSVVHQESGTIRCCGTGSAVWNKICRELDQADLEHAFEAVDRDQRVVLDLVLSKGRHAADALIEAARARGADEIVLADPRASRLGVLERRRLRRRSPAPVTAAVRSPV
jgi:nucleotide-binding universal stress UspA family protein